MTATSTSRLTKLIDLCDCVLGGVASTAAAIMVLIVTAEVVARYVLQSSIIFANELARIMFIWVIFLGIPLALSRGRHVGIDMLEQALPRALAMIVFRASCVLVAVLMAVVFLKSAETMSFNWMQRLQTLPFSASWFYVPIPIGCGFSILYLAIMFVLCDKTLIRDEGLAEQ